MRLVDPLLETKAIKTIVSSSNEVGRAKLMSKLSVDHFYDETSKTTFSRIATLTQNKGKFPSWEELLTDPGLSQEVREELKDNKKVKPFNGGNQIKRLYEQVNDYRKLRTLYFEARNIIESLDNAESFPDVDDMLTGTLDNLSKARMSSKDVGADLIIGLKDNSDKMIKSLLSDERPSVVPTGFRTFDEKNRGILPGSLMVLAATTGSGKSSTAMNMAMNMASAGKSICFIPLEMSKRHMLGRMISSVASISVEKFLLTRLTVREKKIAKKKWREFIEALQKFTGAIRIFEPDEDYTMQELLTLRAPYKEDVIFIDYIGLLGGLDVADQWKKLGSYARYAKRWAEINNSIVVILAQLSEEGLVRYSRAMKEHADILWSWHIAGDTKEDLLIPITQQKARTVGDVSDFILKFILKFMRVEAPTVDDIKETEDNDDEPNEADKYLDDVST